MATKSFGFHNYQIASVYSNKDLKPCKFYVRWFPSVVCLEKKDHFFFFLTFQSLLSIGIGWGFILRGLLWKAWSSWLRDTWVTSKGFLGLLWRRGLRESSFSPSTYNQRAPTPQKRPLSPTEGPLAGGSGLKETRVLLWLGGTSALLRYSSTSPVSAPACWKSTQLEEARLVKVSWPFKAWCWG